MLELINKIKTGIDHEDYYHLLTELNCAVVETELPPKCKGFTLNGEEGHIVYINNVITPDQQRAALMHEFLHVYNEDFSNEKRLDEKERG